jgi:hypothetical protein
MTTLTDFFKESDSSLGVFYPKHYVIGTFPTLEKTEEAVQALRCAGFSDDEVLAVPGSEILQYFAEFRANASLWSSVMTTLSRAFGTEQVFADDDAELARSGAGFLAVHSPDDASTARVRSLVEPFAPRALHWYQSGGVQSLI